MRNLCAMVCIAAVILSACATGGSKSSVSITDVQILKSGIYEGTFIRRENTATSHGKKNVYEDFEFINDSSRVPAKIGTRFGFKIALRGEPDGKEIKIKVLRHHPPMKNPHKNKIILLSEYNRTFKLNKPQVIGYGFDEEWELVEGEHLFQLLYNEEILIEKSFVVYKP